MEPLQEHMDDDEKCEMKRTMNILNDQTDSQKLRNLKEKGRRGKGRGGMGRRGRVVEVEVVFLTLENARVSVQARTCGDCQTPQDYDSQASAPPAPSP